MMKPIILLNAPARSGKDTLANEFLANDPETRLFSFKFPLFKLFCDTVNISYEDFISLYETEGWKDTPNDKYCNGKTPRSLLIHISENYIKPFFGKEYFGKELADSIESTELLKDTEFTWIIPDSGFIEETYELVDKFEDRVICVQFTRDGLTFEGDSRNWVETPITIKLDHPGNPRDMMEMVKNSIRMIGEYDI